jgi:hypothetical protein
VKAKAAAPKGNVGERNNIHQSVTTRKASQQNFVPSCSLKEFFPV